MKIVSELLKLQGVLAVQLTGSMLLNHSTPDSDIDLIVYALPEFDDSHLRLRVITPTHVCHWRIVKIDSIILPISTVPAWRLYGNIYLPKLTTENIWSESWAGEQFVRLLLEHTEIATLSSRAILVRHQKLVENLLKETDFACSNKTVFNVLWAARILGYAQIAEDTLVNFKHKIISLKELYSEVKWSDQIVIDDTTSLTQKIDDFNKHFYTEFQEKLNCNI